MVFSCLNVHWASHLDSSHGGGNHIGSKQAICEVIGWSQLITQMDGDQLESEREVGGSVLHTTLSLSVFPSCLRGGICPYLGWLSTSLWKQWADGEMQQQNEGERMKGKQLLPLNSCSSYRHIRYTTWLSHQKSACVRARARADAYIKDGMGSVSHQTMDTVDMQHRV